MTGLRQEQAMRQEHTGNTGNTQPQTNGGAGTGTAANVAVSEADARKAALDRVPGATDADIRMELEFDDGYYILRGRHHLRAEGVRVRDRRTERQFPEVERGEKIKRKDRRKRTMTDYTGSDPDNEGASAALKPDMCPGM